MVVEIFRGARWYLQANANLKRALLKVAAASAEETSTAWEPSHLTLFTQGSTTDGG